MDRNLLLAFALSFMVLSLWSMWQEAVAPPPPPPGEERVLEPPIGGEPDAAPDAARRFPDLPDAETVPAAPRSPSGSGTLGEPAAMAELAPGQTIRQEHSLFHAELDSRGAGVRDWELLSYTDREGASMVMTSPGAGALAMTPFLELGLGDLSQTIWEVESQNGNEVAFRIDRQGVTIRKHYFFDSEGYGFRLRLDVENGSTASIAPRFLIDWPAEVREGQDWVEYSMAVLHDGDLEKQPLAGIGSPGFFGSMTGSTPVDAYDYPGEIDWVGSETPYFLTAIFPDSPVQASARIVVVKRGSIGASNIFFDPVQIPPGQSATREYRAYLGPKEVARLEAIGGRAVESIDLGWSWVQPLTRAFNWMLHAIYSVVPNYGLAIILLTILVRVVTAPLTVKQMRSMERLRRVQPKLKVIQEKHKDDRQKQSEAMMALYKQEKVNPLGGCLPMVLQLPVFIGLFYALRSSIHLRHAPFVGWIDDLSAPDTLFEIPGLGVPVRVLPIIMGASMVLQQKITPMQADPAQAKMMMTVMPIMMTVLFYQFPSGLVLYWMMSNVLAISHQLWIGRNMGPTPEPGGRKEAEASS